MLAERFMVLTPFRLCRRFLLAWLSDVGILELSFTFGLLGTLSTYWSAGILRTI
jgi:hypothetical protein